MRTLIKLILAIIIIAIAGLIALPFIVDPNDYKQEISDQVEQATGRTLIIDGDIGLSVFPWIALELGPVSLSNAQGFTADTFAKVSAAEIRIKLMPLLQKQLELDTILLDGLVLNLEKNKNGETNWDDLTGGDSNKASDSSKKSDVSAGEAGSVALVGITIAGVQLTNANIIWSDLSTSEHYQLKDLNLTTDSLVIGEPTALNMDFNINSAKPQATAHISLTTNVMVDMDTQQYALSDLNLAIQAEGQELPFSHADLALTGDISADMVKQLITMEGLSLSINANKDEQVIDAKLTTQISANLASQQTTLTDVNLTAEITDPAMPGGKVDIKLNTTIVSDLDQQTLTVSELVISVYDLIINADLNVSKLLSDNPTATGELNIKPFNLRKLSDKLAIELPEMADNKTLELVQVNSKFTGSAKHFNAKQLTITLDQSKLNGQVAIANFEHPAINFTLALDEIDADRYLPPVSKEEQKAIAPPASAAAAVATELPLDTLRQLNIKGMMDIGKLKISNTHSEKIHLEINAADGLIKLHPISADLYQGQYQGNVNLDARGKTLKIAIDEKLNNIQIGPLLKDLTGDDAVSGLTNIKVKLTGNGATVDQIKQTLSGKGNFSFTDGALKGFNIAESIRQARAAIKGEKVPTSDGPLKTDFAKMTGSFTVKKGIVNNQDFIAMSPLLRINGAGTVDLPKERLNYKVNVSIVETSKGQTGKDLADLKGLTIPVVVSGSFNDPAISVDLVELLKQKANQELQNRAADKLKEKYGIDLGGLLGTGGGGSTEEDKSSSSNKPDEKLNQKSEPEPKSDVEEIEDAIKSFKKFF